MVLETIVYPVIVAIIGGVSSAVYGAYRATKGGEEFDGKKFINAVPKSIVGAIVALGLGVISPELTNVLTLQGFLAVFGIGFMANELLKGKKAPAKPVEE